MESKTVKIVIIISVIIGIIAIVGITALVVTASKSSEPKVIDLNEDNNVNEYLETDEEEVNSETEEDEEENLEIETNKSDNNTNSNNNSEESNNNNEIAENTSNETGKEKTGIEAFNAMFTPYEGERVKGTDVNTLIQMIRKNNEVNQNFIIKILANVQKWDKENNSALSDEEYKIYFEKEETGRINVLKIEDAD